MRPRTEHCYNESACLNEFEAGLEDRSTPFEMSCGRRRAEQTCAGADRSTICQVLGTTVGSGGISIWGCFTHKNHYFAPRIHCP